MSVGGRLGASAALGVAALCSACEVPPTQLVVVVRTDMDVPGELDAFSTTVTGPGTTAARGPFALTGVPPEALPATFGVRPRDGEVERRVTVAVTARRGGSDLFTTRAATTFLEHKKLQLDVFLAERCIVEAGGCTEPGLTCTDEGCVPEDRDPNDLPEWQGLPEPDGGVARCGDGVEPGPWASLLASGGSINATDLAVDGAGRAHVVGTFRASPSFQGLDPVTSVDADGFWVCFDRVGCPCWDAPRVLGGAEGDPDELRIGVSADGQAVIAGTVGAGQIVLGDDIYGDTGFVARFDGDGDYLGGASVEAAGGWSAQSVVVTSSGAALVAGLARGSLAVGGATATLADTTTGAVILFDPDLGSPRIATMSSTVDLSALFAAEAPDGSVAAAGALADGILSVNGIASDLSNTASSFVVSLEPSDMQVRWGGPVLGGPAFQPRVLPVASATNPLLFAASVASPEAVLGAERIDVPADRIRDVVVAGVSEDGIVSNVQLIGTGPFVNLGDACSDGGGAFLVGDRDGGGGFVVGLDEDRRVSRPVEDLAGPAGLVAASPAGDVVVVLGSLGVAAEIGGHPLGPGLYVYSLDPAAAP